MIVADVKIEVRKTEPSASPKRDALQVLPGTVRVIVTTEDGVIGERSAGFGWIAGAQDALAAQIEHELKPLVMVSDVGQVRATHQAMLRETETCEKGPHPVMMSLIVRRRFNDDGVLLDTHGVYPTIARSVVRDMDIAFVDML